MKGSAISGLIIVALIIVALALFLGLGQEKPKDTIIVISNATYNYANQSFNQTTNETIVINNTYYIGGSVTIPFENVTSGTGTGDYKIKATGFAASPFIVERPDMARPYFKIGELGQVIWYQDGTALPAFQYTPSQFQNEFLSRVIIESTSGDMLIDFKSDDGSGSYNPQQIISYANITYDSTYIIDKIICPIVHRGTQQNFTMCINQTGSVIETIGEFPA